MENQTPILKIVENINLSVKGIPITFESIADKFVYLNQKLAANNPNKNAILVWVTDNVLPYYKTAIEFDSVFEQISQSIKSQISSGTITVPSIAKTKKSSTPKKEKTTTRKPKESSKKTKKEPSKKSLNQPKTLHPTLVISPESITTPVPKNFNKNTVDSLARLMIEASDTVRPVIVERVSPVEFKVVSGHLQYAAAIRATEIDPNFELRSVVIEKGNPEYNAVMQQESAYDDIAKMPKNATLANTSKNAPTYEGTKTEKELKQLIGTRTLDIDSITSHKGGKYSTEAVDVLAQHILETGGNIRPIVVRRTSPIDFELLSGNLEYLAAKRASEINPQYTSVRAFIVDSRNESAILKQLDIFNKKSKISENNKKESLKKNITKELKSIKNHITGKKSESLESTLKPESFQGINESIIPSKISSVSPDTLESPAKDELEGLSIAEMLKLADEIGNKYQVPETPIQIADINKIAEEAQKQSKKYPKGRVPNILKFIPKEKKSRTKKEPNILDLIPKEPESTFADINKITEEAQKQSKKYPKDKEPNILKFVPKEKKQKSPRIPRTKKEPSIKINDSSISIDALEKLVIRIIKKPETIKNIAKEVGKLFENVTGKPRRKRTPKSPSGKLTVSPRADIMKSANITDIKPYGSIVSYDFGGGLKPYGAIVKKDKSDIIDVESTEIKPYGSIIPYKYPYDTQRAYLEDEYKDTSKKNIRKPPKTSTRKTPISENSLLLDILGEIKKIKEIIKNIIKNQNSYVKYILKKDRTEKENKAFKQKEAELEAKKKDISTKESGTKESGTKGKTTSSDKKNGFLDKLLGITVVSAISTLNQFVNGLDIEGIFGAIKDSPIGQIGSGIFDVVKNAGSSIFDFVQNAVGAIINPVMGAFKSITGLEGIVPFADGGVINPLPNQPKIQELPNQNLSINDQKQTESDDIKKSFAEVMTLPLKVVGASIMSAMNDFVSDMPVSDNNIISELNSFSSRLASAFGLRTSPKFSENPSKKSSDIDYTGILKSSLDIKQSVSKSSITPSSSNKPITSNISLSTSSNTTPSSIAPSSSNKPTIPNTSGTSPSSIAPSTTPIKTSSVSGFNSKPMLNPRTENSDSLSGTDTIFDMPSNTKNYSPSDTKLNVNNYRISAMNSFSTDDKPNIITLPPNIINNKNSSTPPPAPPQSFVYTAKPLRSGRQNDIRNLTISGAIV